LAGITAQAGSAAVLTTDCVVKDGRVVVLWQAPCDMALAGYYVDRRDEKTGRFDRITPQLVESSPQLDAETWYESVDPMALPGQTNTYRLVEVRTDGRECPGVPFAVCSHHDMASQASGMAAPVSSSLPAALASAAVPGARVKILTAQAGVYGVSAESLAANLEGIAATDVVQRIATGQFRLTCGTNEIAWTPDAGNTGLLFYATAADSIYTTNNVYWIDPLPGTVMSVRQATAPGPAVEGLTFRDISHFEDDHYADYTIYSDPEADIWYWAKLTVTSNTAASANWPVNLPWAQAGEGWLKVELKGSSTDPALPHHARISLNGQLLGSTDWVGYNVSSESFAATNWMAGTNIVTIEEYWQPGDASVSVCQIVSLDASYGTLFRAFNDVLECPADSNAVLTADGFSRAGIRVFDISDPLRPVALEGEGVVIEPATNSQWRVTFAPDSPAGRYWITAGDPLAPVAVAGRPAARWSTPSHRADYVVVFHHSLKDGAQALVDYRQSKGLESLGIDIEDIYDEFSSGTVTPHAIRSFLQYAQAHWDRAPAMAVLAGVGNFNYRNIGNNTNAPCLIPPIMVRDNGPVGLVGVDMPLGDTDGDRVPDIVIGRLPILSSNQMWEAVRKIMAVEAAATNCTPVSLVTDANDPGLGVWGDFSQSSDLLASFISAPYVRDCNYGSATSSMTFVRERFVEQLNQPRTLVTYMGHANDMWLGLSATDGYVLKTDDLPRLTNSAPSLLLGMTCLFGRSSYPRSGGGLAEQLVRKATGGVAAVWSCAATSYSDDNTRIGTWLVKSCFRRNGLRLGTAIKEAIVAYSRDPAYWPWVVETYSLVGDPALDLGFLSGEPKTYEEWRRAAFTEEQQADPEISDPLADPDHDGFSNQDEYRAGTLPQDAGSRLWISAAALAGPEHRWIQWPGESNRLYAVEWSTNGLVSFQEKAAYLWATPPFNVYTDAVSSGCSPVFYRVKLMDVP